MSVSMTLLGMASSLACPRLSVRIALLGNAAVQLQNCRAMSSTRSPAIVPPRGQHKSTVFFFHGLGDQGDGWSEMFESEMRHPNTKYVCPHSDSRAVALNMNMKMPAWYNLYGLDATAREDSEGIAAASRYVHNLIDAEVASGIPSEKIIVGGFSMGGALALYAGLTYPRKLGGILGLSSFLLQRDKLPGNHTANLNTPIFLGHGSNDFLVPLSFGQMTETVLKGYCSNVSLHIYRGMAHSSCPEELSDAKNFIDSNINN